MAVRSRSEEYGKRNGGITYQSLSLARAFISLIISFVSSFTMVIFPYFLYYIWFK